MLDMKEVMKEVADASRTEGTLVSCKNLFDDECRYDSFVLRDEVAGAFLFQAIDDFIDIYSVSNKIHHTVLDEDDLQCFINSVIRGIDPYIG